jgi:hypothetical protein
MLNLLVDFPRMSFSNAAPEAMKISQGGGEAVRR